MTPLLLGLIGLGLFSSANSEVRRFEKAAAAEIGSKLQGENKQVSVKAKVGPEAIFGDFHAVRIQASQFHTDGLPLFTEPRRSTKGHVRMLNIDLQDFTLGGLPIRRLRADIPDCRFDFSLALRRRQIRLSRSGMGVGEVEVAEKDLERFILAKYPEVKRATVRINRDKVIVDGYGEFLLLATNFWVVAKLEPVDGNKLVLTHARVLFDGRDAGEAGRNALLQVLNPVVDLDRDLNLYGAIQVQRLVLRDGVLRASGPTKIPDKPEGR